MISFHQANMRGDINARNESGLLVAVIYPIQTKPRCYNIMWDVVNLNMWFYDLDEAKGAIIARHVAQRLEQS